jgi:hypothetical protein
MGCDGRVRDACSESCQVVLDSDPRHNNVYPEGFAPRQRTSSRVATCISPGANGGFAIAAVRGAVRPVACAGGQHPWRLVNVLVLVIGVRTATRADCRSC